MTGRNNRRRLRSRALPIVLCCTLIVGLVFTMIALMLSPGETPEVNAPVEPVSVPVSEPEKIPEPAEVRLLGVGDNLIHEAIYRQANRRAGGEGYDFEYAYQNVREMIASADIASINQETVMVAEKPLSSYPMFNSPTQLGDYLSKIGFDVANLANNHSLDMVPSAGNLALTSYLSFWKTHPEVLTTGLYENDEDAQNIRLLERNGITFAFLGATEWTNGLSLPKNSDVLLMMTQDEEALRAQIEKAKSLADVVVMNVHWGIEYTHDPNEGQRELAQKMVDWGVDIILGHHPHVIQPVEYLTRADGTRGVVVYSLGNFISAQETGDRMIGGALDVTVRKDFSTGEIELTKVRFIPLITQFEGNWANIRIYPYDQYTAELANSHGVRAGKTPQFSMEFIDSTVQSVIDQQFLTD